MEAFIVRAKLKHGDRYEYPPQEFINMTTAINIICAKHKTSNSITPFAHLQNGGGCNQCSIEGRRLTMAKFIEKAKKKHNNLYKYNPSHIYLGAKYYLIANCSIHGDFEVQGGNHLNGHGCQKCGKENGRQKRLLSMEEVIKRVKEVHGEDYVIPEQEYINSHTKFKAICKKHGEFSITPESIMYGYGCQKCANEGNSERKMSNLTEFIKRAKEMHGDKYEYDTTQMYEGYKKKLKITCNKHGDFYQFPSPHIHGNGCRECMFNKLSHLFRSNILEFIEKANKVHDNRYTYDNTQDYVNSYVKVKVICNEHGIFEITPVNHLSGSGCRICFHQISKPANEWLASIEKQIGRQLQRNNSPDGEFRIPETRYSADGYDVITNTIYEFLGDFWHGNPNIYPPEFTSKNHKKNMGERYADTLRKKETCLKLGYNYVEVWESDFMTNK